MDGVISPKEFLDYGALGAAILLAFMCLWFLRWVAGRLMEMQEKSVEALDNSRRTLENSNQVLSAIREELRHTRTGGGP